jgi:hypothetical protein
MPDILFVVKSITAIVVTVESDKVKLNINPLNEVLLFFQSIPGLEKVPISGNEDKICRRFLISYIRSTPFKQDNFLAENQ